MTVKHCHNENSQDLKNDIFTTQKRYPVELISVAVSVNMLLFVKMKFRFQCHGDAKGSHLATWIFETILGTNDSLFLCVQ